MSRIRDAAEAYANAFPNNERRDLLYQGKRESVKLIFELHRRKSS